MEYIIMEDINKLDNACLVIWGQLMITGQFEEAIGFALLARRIGKMLGDMKFSADANSLMLKSYQEMLSSSSESTKGLSEINHSCSFCGQSPPKVRLGAGPDAFICNECVVTFSEVFSSRK